MTYSLVKPERFWWCALSLIGIALLGIFGAPAAWSAERVVLCEEVSATW